MAGQRLVSVAVVLGLPKLSGSKLPDATLGEKLATANLPVQLQTYKVLGELGMPVACL